ncbi:hypothetical protein [Haladaptatus halobius]|uniref:hypothetical protein n=1 Tax=Haladaptatus halobius TaxID=2884875 RepID=UPI001D0AE80E|nr:hypothetical protein [Haladaptatus halobius]
MIDHYMSIDTYKTETKIAVFDVEGELVEAVHMSDANLKRSLGSTPEAKQPLRRPATTSRSPIPSTSIEKSGEEGHTTEKAEGNNPDSAK